MAAKVLDIPELLEQILLDVPMRTLLLSQRVCRDFKSTIDDSPKLQRALFFLPDLPKPATKKPRTDHRNGSPGPRIKFNPLLVTVTGGAASFERSISLKVDPHSVQHGSCMRMYLCQTQIPVSWPATDAHHKHMMDTESELAMPLSNRKYTGTTLGRMMRLHHLQLDLLVNTLQVCADAGIKFGDIDPHEELRRLHDTMWQPEWALLDPVYLINEQELEYQEEPYDPESAGFTQTVVRELQRLRFSYKPRKSMRSLLKITKYLVDDMGSTGDPRRPGPSLFREILDNGNLLIGKPTFRDVSNQIYRRHRGATP